MNASAHTSHSDAELLAAMRMSSEEELRFFSNDGKEARERWVVSQFLSRRQLAFDESELTSPQQQSKTDVLFRNANFQIKEILTPGSKRGEEVKSTYNRLKNAKSLGDAVGPSFVYDVPPPTTIYALVSAEAAALASDARYQDVKAGLDLLFYVTRTRASPILEKELNKEKLAHLGWRSISCLAGSHATVLFAEPGAPTFLHV